MQPQLNLLTANAFTYVRTELPASELGAREPQPEVQPEVLGLLALRLVVKLEILK